MNILIIIYLIFGWAMVLMASIVMLQAFANFHFMRKRVLQFRPPHNFTPPVDLICPCCGLDPGLDDNLRRLLVQDYPDYKVIFTVAVTEDPAVAVIRPLLDEFGSERACLVIAGRATTCAQKVHNQLQAIRRGSRNATVLAFVDSDIHPQPKWLRHLVDPLVRPAVGVVTGYRWYVPTRYNLATVMLSCLNGLSAALGPHNHNRAWGGAMAVRREHFDRLGIADIWSGSITDDLTLSTAIRRAKLRVAFEPKCFTASCDSFTWSRLFEFARRQFIITRVCAPWVWLLALGASLQYALAFWLGLFLTIWSWQSGHAGLHFVWPVPAILYGFAVVKAVLRRVDICIALPDHAAAIKPATWMDILGSPLVNLVMLVCVLASSLARTITWRGITYRLHRGGKTDILSNSQCLRA